LEFPLRVLLVAHLDSRRSNNKTGNLDSNNNSVDSSHPKALLQDSSSHRINSPNLVDSSHPKALLQDSSSHRSNSPNLVDSSHPKALLQDSSSHRINSPNLVDSSHPKALLQDSSSHRSNSPNTGSTSNRLLLVQLISRLLSKTPPFLLNNPHSSSSRPLSLNSISLRRALSPLLSQPLISRVSRIKNPSRRSRPLEEIRGLRDKQCRLVLFTREGKRNRTEGRRKRTEQGA
jgi:hypothetical protein